jgi:hypothetical protein
VRFVTSVASNGHPLPTVIEVAHWLQLLRLRSCIMLYLRNAQERDSTFGSAGGHHTDGTRLALGFPSCRHRLRLLRKVLGSIAGIHHGTLTPSQTTEREKKRRTAPKRHQIKHLEFVLSYFGTRGSEVQILSPRPIRFNRLHFRRLLELSP